MNTIDYIRSKGNIIQEIAVNELKYIGSTQSVCRASLFVFPRVIIYEIHGGNDATYIFLTEEKIECYLAFALLDYFEGDVVRKRIDFDKNMDMYLPLFKRYIVLHNSDEAWMNNINFFTDSRLPEIMQVSDKKNISAAIREASLGKKNFKEIEKMKAVLPIVRVSCNWKEKDEFCFPAFLSDKRFMEITSPGTSHRQWYGERIKEKPYSSFTKNGISVKLCSYQDIYSTSDILLIFAVIGKYMER